MKDKVLFWNMVALVAVVVVCLIAGWVSPGRELLGGWVVAWLMFGYASAGLATVQLVIAAIRSLWKDADARSWWLAGLITAIVGPGLCAVSGTATSLI